MSTKTTKLTKTQAALLASLSTDAWTMQPTTARRDNLQATSGWFRTVRALKARGLVETMSNGAATFVRALKESAT